MGPQSLRAPCSLIIPLLLQCLLNLILGFRVDEKIENVGMVGDRKVEMHRSSMRDPARYVRGDMKVEILVYRSDTNSPCHLFLVYGTGPFDRQLSPLELFASIATDESSNVNNGERGHTARATFLVPGHP